MARRLLSLGLAAAGCGVGHAFYLPGVAPRTFGPYENVDVKVNKLTSVHTQLPMDYYSLPFCRPKSGVKRYAENLGEFLTGDRIENSPYQIYMQHDQACKVLCQVELTKHDLPLLRTAVKREYRHNWIIDNLPAASVIETVGQGPSTSYSQGFRVGYMQDGKYYINNHVHIMVGYHARSNAPEPPARVVSFYVEPFSVAHAFKAGANWDGESDAPPLDTCDPNNILEPVGYGRAPMELAEGAKVLFTYDVLWTPSDKKWASRWDVYLTMDNSVPNKVHWFSIMNSLLIVLFLTGMISMILVRNLHRDIMRYNRVPTEEEKAEEREETGWKLVHADVFRPPSKNPMLFCVFVGTGVQLMCMGFVTIGFAAVGFLSPANRGSLAITMLLLYVLMGVCAGYCSATLYKSFKGRQWQQCTLLTAFLFPGLSFGTFFALNLVSWSYGSTQAVPIPEITALLALWFCISVPLVFLGAYFGYRKETLPYPVVTSNIPRQVPDQPWFLWGSFTVAVGGILPFGSVFVEMFFILNSLWMGRYYYVFGFLLLVFVILLVTCADITMVFCYFQLCAEDYHWWWRSFLTSGSTAIYIFLYSMVYFSHLETNFYVTYMLYFGYMAVISLGVFLLTGCMGFYSCLWFTRKIYSSIKVD